MTNNQAKYGLSAVLLSLAAAGIALALMATPQSGGAEDMAAYAPTIGSGRVAALPAPIAIPQETPAKQNEKSDELWTDFSVGVDAPSSTPAAKQHPYYGIPTELDVE